MIRAIVICCVILLTIGCGPSPLTIFNAFADSKVKMPQVFDLDCSSKVRFTMRKVPKGTSILSSSGLVNISVGNCVYGTTKAVKVSLTRPEIAVFECYETDYTSKLLIYVGKE